MRVGKNSGIIYSIKMEDREVLDYEENNNDLNWDICCDCVNRWLVHQLL